MSDSKSAQEPTMEEILASIRRIISEDGEPDEGGEESGAAAETEVEAVADEAPSEEEPEAAEAKDEDVLELTEDMVAEEEPAPEPEPESAPEPAPAPTPAPEIAEVPAAPPPAPPPAAAEGLVSPATAASATDSFAQLAGAASAARDVPFYGDSARTLEQLVKELLKPMLKEWLDANLPHMVERLVGKEISKLAARSDDD